VPGFYTYHVTHSGGYFEQRSDRKLQHEGSSQGPSGVHAVDCGETAKNITRRHPDGQADLRAQRFATFFRYNLKNARNL